MTSTKPIDMLMPDRKFKMSQAICITCGKDEGYLDFRDELSVTEWRISGMCQDCQDSVFGGEE